MARFVEVKCIHKAQQILVVGRRCKTEWKPRLTDTTREKRTKQIMMSEGGFTHCCCTSGGVSSRHCTLLNPRPKPRKWPQDARRGDCWFTAHLRRRRRAKGEKPPRRRSPLRVPLYSGSLGEVTSSRRTLGRSEVVNHVLLLWQPIRYNVVM